MNFDQNIVLLDPKMDALKLQMSKFMSHAQENHMEGKKTLFFIYYSGHGMMDTQTMAVLNKKDKYTFPLERKIRTLGMVEDTMIISLFDCCREKMPKTASKGITDGDDEDEGPSKETDKYALTFGCSPTYGVEATANIAGQYLRHLRNFASEHDDKIVLPFALSSFQDKHGKAETVVHCPVQTVLSWGAPGASEYTASTSAVENFAELQDYEDVPRPAVEKVSAGALQMFKSGILGWGQSGNGARIVVKGAIPNTIHACTYTMDSTGFAATFHEEMGGDSEALMDAGQAADAQFKFAYYDKFMTWMGYKTYTGKDWIYLRKGDEVEISYDKGTKVWSTVHKPADGSAHKKRTYKD